MTDTNIDPATGEGEGQDDPFAGLESQATALEGAAQTATDERVQEQAASTIAATADELVEALKLVRAMGAAPMAWWDQYHIVWSDKALDGIAQAAAAVMQRHGWTMSDAWAKLGPYIALIAATAPPSLVTWQAVKNRQAQLAHQQRQQPARTAVVPTAETVQAAP